MSLRRLAPLLPLVILLVSVAVWRWSGSPTRMGGEGEGEPGRGNNPSAVQGESPTETERGFRRWMEDFRRVPSEGRVSEGVAWARERRHEMARLIREAPEEALRRGLSWAEHAALPEAVRSLVEEPFSGVGRWTVVADCAGGGVTHHVEMDGQRWNAKAWGGLEVKSSKTGTPLQGLRLDGWAAVRPGAWQRLEPGDREAWKATAAPREGRSFFSAKPLEPDAVPVLAAGRVRWLASEAEAERAEKLVAQADAVLSDRAGGPTVTEYLAFAGGGSPGTLEDALAVRAVEPLNAGVTAKRVVVMVASFLDVAANITPEELVQVFNGPVSENFSMLSYGKAAIEATAVPVVVPLGKPAADYLPGKYFEIFDDTVAQAKALGHDVAPYDIRCVYFPGIGAVSASGSGFSGLGSVGGDRLWLQGNSSSHVITHELGHNYGLRHANSWQPSGANAVGAGSSLEYGDVYDTMGGGSMPLGHFHPHAKRLLGWLGESDLLISPSSGVYRIYRFDHPQSTGLRGIRLDKAAGEYYWLGYRRNFQGMPTFARGAYLIWQRSGLPQSWLVDTTPGSAGGTGDAGIGLGRTYSDAAAGIHITPVAQGGEGPAEYLDVRIHVGPAPGNSPPTATIDAPATYPARRPLILSATASDPDSDQIHYSWAFGDGQVSANSAMISKIFPLGGAYTISLTVSDGRGGVTTTQRSIEVTDNAFIATDRASGTTIDWHGLAHDGTHAVAVGSQGYISRSADGVTWTTTQLNRFYNFWKVIWSGNQFVVTGNVLDLNISKFVGAILTSPDGVTWTERHRGGPDLFGLASNGSIFVATGRDGRLLRSTDYAVTWSPVTSPISRLWQGAAWGGDRFYAVGYSNPRTTVGLIQSADGLTWTDESSRIPPAIADLRHIEWLNERLVTSGFQAKMLTSLDRGNSWITAAVNRYYEMWALAYGNGIFFASGQYVEGGQFKSGSAVSADGVNWISLAGSPPSARYAASFFKDRLITVGASGIIQSTDILDAPPPTWSDWKLTSGVTDPAADADNDGESNLLDYALGSAGVAALEPEFIVDETGDSAPVLRLTRAARRPDVLYHVEIADSLDPGAWTTTGLTPLVDTDTELRFAMPPMTSSANRRFARLRALLAEQ